MKAWDKTKRIASASIEPRAWVTKAAKWWLGPEPEAEPEPDEPRPVRPEPDEPEHIRPSKPEHAWGFQVPPERTLQCLHGDECLSIGSKVAYRIYADGCVECVPCADHHTEGKRR